MSSYRIDELSVDQLDRISLPKFQRGFVWTKKKQEDFVQTLHDDTPLVLYLFIRRTITIKMRSSNYWTGSSVYLLLRSIGKIHCSFGNR